MHNLGQTRSSHQRNHLLLTPDTFVRTALPGMRNASAIVHVGPALGAGFTDYTVEFEPKGELGNTSAQRFLYVTEGVVTLETEGKAARTGRARLCYLSEGFSHRVAAKKKSRVAVIEKPLRAARENRAATPAGLQRRCGFFARARWRFRLQVKCLLPDEPQFDFAVNTMVYQPGASLSMVEMHVMEHGLNSCLEGGGIYRLGDRGIRSPPVISSGWDRGARNGLGLSGKYPQNI